MIDGKKRQREATRKHKDTILNSVNTDSKQPKEKSRKAPHKRRKDRTFLLQNEISDNQEVIRIILNVSFG